eukprot:TRINITY_DN71560_c0_g1_i1.p1 TRINITY_DN71560_c0_g1~~TRINITY_DN71560_c0_g1_i1.p1  ORF type:complete len:304 (-),score=81.50 TRINITY_DN71560_c0_g1_i1:135-971(-)
MGNVLSECQRVSIGQCELCTEVLARGHLEGSGSTPGDAAAGARRAQPGGRQHHEAFDLGQLSEAEMMAHALRLSRLEHEQAHGVTAPRPLSEEERREQAAAEELARAKREEEALERQRLRDEQAAEYEESLRIDRERENEKLRRLQEEEEARKKEEERQAQEAKEEEERQQALAARIEEARQRLPPEPEAAAAEAEGGRVVVALRLPDGRRLKRAFLGSHLVGHIYDFVDTEGGEAIASETYRVVETMPRRVFEDRDLTLADAGLQGQCALLIEIIDP